MRIRNAPNKSDTLCAHGWNSQPPYALAENREHFVSSDIPSPDSSVSIATRYGLDGPGIESR